LIRLDRLPGRARAPELLLTERLVLRRPEQWYWVHRRWKEVAHGARRRKLKTVNA